MKDTDPVHFFSSEEMLPKARKVFIREKELLEKILPLCDIQHVGSCAVPGAIGKFDVDIQIRVDKGVFKKVLETMKDNLKEKHPEMWTDEFAIFKKETEECPIDYCLTVIDSKNDDYYKVRDYFISHPDFLEEYNSMKRSFEGKPYSEYRKAKQSFLGGNGSVWFLK